MQTIPQFGKAVAGKIYRDRPGAYAIIVNRQTQFATVKWRQHYFLPGGGIEAGETARAALHREVLEEIGWSIRIQSEIARSKQFVHNEVKARYFNKLQTFFSAHPLELITTNSETDHELVWLPADGALASLTEKSQRWALQTYLNQ